jgi:hypothetical protein
MFCANSTQVIIARKFARKALRNRDFPDTNTQPRDWLFANLQGFTAGAHTLLPAVLCSAAPPERQDFCGKGNAVADNFLQKQQQQRERQFEREESAPVQFQQAIVKPGVGVSGPGSALAGPGSASTPAVR